MQTALSNIYTYSLCSTNNWSNNWSKVSPFCHIVFFRERFYPEAAYGSVLRLKKLQTDLQKMQSNYEYFSLCMSNCMAGAIAQHVLKLYLNDHSISYGESRWIVSGHSQEHYKFFSIEFYKTWLLKVHHNLWGNLVPSVLYVKFLTIFFKV